MATCRGQAEEERIVGAGGFVVSGRVCRCLAVARALGDHQFKQDETLMQDEQMVSASLDGGCASSRHVRGAFVLGAACVCVCVCACASPALGRVIAGAPP